MSISRRSFFGRASVAALTAGVLLNGETALAGPRGKVAKSAFPIPPESATQSLAYLGRESFAAKVGTTFLFQDESGRFANLTLVSVADTRTEKALKADGGRVESFTLAFSGLRRSKLGIGSYFVSHVELGSFDLFLSGAVSGRMETRYEAVVSRLIG